jgi:hypothetical protein
MVWLHARSWRARHFVLNSTKREAIKKRNCTSIIRRKWRKYPLVRLEARKLRGSTVRCSRGHLRGTPWLRHIFRGRDSHNSENLTKKCSLSYWSRALSNFSFLVFRFSGLHKERPKLYAFLCSTKVYLRRLRLLKRRSRRE